MVLGEDGGGEGELGDLVVQVADLLALPGDGLAEPGYGLAEPFLLIGDLLRLGADAECCWAALSPGLTPHGLRHGHETAMRRDKVPRVLRRDRLGHGRSADITDHYTHIDREMIDDLLAAQTRRWQSAVAARARIDQSRGAEPRSAVPALDEWLAPYRERAGESSSHLRSHRHLPVGGS